MKFCAPNEGKQPEVLTSPWGREVTPRPQNLQTIVRHPVPYFQTALSILPFSEFSLYYNKSHHQDTPHQAPFPPLLMSILSCWWWNPRSTSSSPPTATTKIVHVRPCSILVATGSSAPWNPPTSGTAAAIPATSHDASLMMVSVTSGADDNDCKSNPRRGP